MRRSVSSEGALPTLRHVEFAMRDDVLILPLDQRRCYIRSVEEEEEDDDDDEPTTLDSDITSSTTSSIIPSIISSDHDSPTNRKLLRPHGRSPGTIDLAEILFVVLYTYLK
jgi:hypothetical protein